MGFLLLSVISNGLLVVLFKLYNRMKVDLVTIVVVNYFFCFLTGLIVDSPKIFDGNPLDKPWTPMVLGLGSLFFISFTTISYAVRFAGIILTTIMMKLSFLALIIYAVMIFGENTGYLKILGAILAAISVLMISWSTGKLLISRHNKELILLILILSFVFSGVIDIAFYYTNKTGIASSSDVQFISFLFLMAALVGSLGWIIRRLKFPHQNLYFKNSLLCGAFLGVINFFSVFFIMSMLESGWEGSILFPIHNLGILMFSVVVGLFIFKERLNSTQSAGLVTALIAISLLISSNM